MTGQPATVEQYAADHLTRQLHNTAASLTDLADTIRRLADDVPRVDGSPGRPHYAGIVGQAVNEINTTLMNLNLGSLANRAAEADTARVKGE
ncbi:hypothetical protein [Micromonospora sp. NBC_00421]|uniref:hypothetical protein n=1 Tax=Micromonospora sp. NBC_00421 TaxID=2975976 RepID=UPI002E1F6023